MSGAGQDLLENVHSKRIALLIAALALLLAFAETGATNSQTNALQANVEASNLWSFFQAKTIRQTTIKTAAESLELEIASVADPALRERAQKRLEQWRATVDRYETEPQTNEGRKELIGRAKASEARRDHEEARANWFEIAAGLFQIGIVLSSAAIIANIVWLAAIAGGLGFIGLGAMALAVLAPASVQLF